MKINIILPFFSPVPSGGVKVMYEISNRLAKEGNDVQIYHALQVSYLHPKTRPYLLRKLISLIRDGNSPYPKWITLHPSITSVFIEKVADNSIRNADVILYTWWSLTPEIVKLSGSKGQKFNLIQGYEVWNGYE